jgi:hypothetical protein
MKKCKKHVTTALLMTLALFLGFFGHSWISTDSSAFAVHLAAAQNIDSDDVTFQGLGQRTLGGNLYRAKIPGGWLVGLVPVDSQQSTSMVFIPDPNHDWDGKSLPK